MGCSGIREESLIRCIYEIKDNNWIQIINNRDGVNINKEIESKIKIWNNNRREKLIFNKKFYQLGLNTVEFKIEEKLTNLSYIFKDCSLLKKIEFIGRLSENVVNMQSMFSGCKIYNQSIYLIFILLM